MNKIEKRLVSAFMAMCVALQGSVCHAGKGKPKKTNKKEPVPPAVELTVNPKMFNKRLLKALRDEVSILLRTSVTVTPREKIPLTELLEKCCYDFNDGEGCEGISEDLKHMIHSFSKFLVRRLDGSGCSDDNMFDGLILFLSSIKRFQDVEAVADPNRDHFCCLALLALDICDIRCEGVYAEWYRLLAPHVTEKFSTFKKQYDREKRDAWRRQLRTVGCDVSRRMDFIRCMLSLLGNFFNAKELEYFYREICIRGSSLGQAEFRANKALEDTQRCISGKTIRDAEDALAELREELSQWDMDDVLAQSARELLDVKQTELNVCKGILTAMEMYKESVTALIQAVKEMEQQKSPESIEKARHASSDCRRLVNFFKNKSQCQFSFDDRQLKKIADECDEKIEHLIAQQYMDATRQCMEAVEERIKDFYKDYSEDVLKAARDAQEECRVALDKCPSDAVKSGAEFAELRARFDTNQQKILSMPEDHRQAKKKIAFDSACKQKLEDRKAEVVLARQRKEEQKQLAAEASRVSKQEGPCDVVFLCDPEVASNPLKFLDDHPQYIKEWNDWYRNAREGKPSGKSMNWRGDNHIYSNDDKLNLDIHLKDGHPDILKYKGGERGKTCGFRIVWYREETSGRVVVLYVGAPFGKVCHNNKWKTLRIKEDWEYVPLAELKK